MLGSMGKDLLLVVFFRLGPTRPERISPTQHWIACATSAYCTNRTGFYELIESHQS